LNPNFLEELNPVQKEAALQTEGPVMILAGAGSGKTRVLTYRIAHLLNKGVDAFNILSLTFTNKAAREMKERIAKLVGNNEARNLWMGTFHSVFAKILRIEAEKLGYPTQFTIYDTDDAKSVLKSVIKDLGLDDKIYKPSTVYSRISAAKNNLLGWQEYMNNTEIQSDDRASAKPRLGEIYKLYHERCFRSSAMDFDDLLFNTNILLRNFPDVLHKYQHKFKYIMVDEYQDTNFSQYVIVKKLAAAFENICVVGDDAQSIYGFRGANIQNILNFEKDYPELKTFKLEQNYRSTKVIVKAANSVISNNKEQFQKDVWTQNIQGEKIKVIKTLTDNEEGWSVANSIFETKMTEQARNKAFAILYRTNAQSRSLEEALRKMSIPYKIYGGLSFYKRKEIKDIIAYFRLVINPSDEEAFKRIINYPARGIGQTTLEKLTVIAEGVQKSVWAILEDLPHTDFGLNAGIRQKLWDFATMIKSFQVQLHTKDAFELAGNIAAHTGILKELYNEKTPEGVSRYENIQELLNGIKDFTENKTLRISPPSENFFEGEFSTETTALKTLDLFMEDIALLTDADEDVEDKDNADKVSLMTVHAAKGLEFPYVYVVGLEENLFPSQMALNSRSDLEEERRLFYVAITRAEKKLTVSYSQSRYKYGNLFQCEPSRFLEEIDEDLLEKPQENKPAKKVNLTEDFPWGGGSSFKKKTSASATPSKTPTPPAPKVIPANLKKINTKEAGITQNVESIGDYVLGCKVEHDKFGTGEITKLEGISPNEKATILFEEIGEKVLILRFAKLRIVEP